MLSYYFEKPSNNCQTEREAGHVSQFTTMAVDPWPGTGEAVLLSPKFSSPAWTDISHASLKAFLLAGVEMFMLITTLVNPCEPCQCLGLTVWWLYSAWSSCTQAWQGIPNLDSLPTRPVCTPGSLINKFFRFDSTVALTITPIVTPIAPARQHIQSTCTGGNASIVSYPPADATPF